MFFKGPTPLNTELIYNLKLVVMASAFIRRLYILVLRFEQYFLLNRIVS